MQSYNTRAMWKYANRNTGRIEFHEKEQAMEELRLVRPPDSVARERATRDTPKPVHAPVKKESPAFGENHED